jgi:hypothetical protein
MPGPSATRRRLLVAAGTVALAGCSELDTGDSGDEISPTELPDVPDPDEIRPVLEDDLPVAIERSRLRDAAARTTDLLGEVPIPLDGTAIPNGHVREELTRAADGAGRHVERARAATTRLSAMRELRNARSDARFSAEGWAFVDSGRTATELREEGRAVVERANGFRSEYEYVGDDPVRAVVVHGHVESLLDRVRRDREPDVHHEASDLLTVAEWGEHVESARANLEDGRYVYEQFESSLSPDARPLDARFDAAADALTAELERRREGLPAEPTDGDGRYVQFVRSRLRSEAERSVDRVRGADETAAPVLEATEGLTYFLAHDRLMSRLEDGEEFQPEDGSDVRAARSGAVEAVRTALEETRRPVLMRGVLVRAARVIRNADREIARIRRSVSPARLDDPMSEYLDATLRARSVPTACEQVLDVLDG